LLAGCSRPTHDEVRADARAHLSEFEVFDAWARRAIEADPAFADRAALEETVFAPIVRDDAVLGAALDRDGVSMVRFGEDVSSIAKQWMPLPLDDAVGLEITTAKLADPRAARDAAERIPCIVLRRTAPLSNRVDLSVTVAYRNTE
jgi:hypothetical protein